MKSVATLNLVIQNYRKMVITVSRLILLILLLTGIQTGLHGQVYPVTITPQIIPPFSPYLNDYLNDINKVKLLIGNTSMNVQNIKFSVSLTSEDNTVQIFNDPTYRPPQAMEIYSLAQVFANGYDLQPYFNKAHVTLKGVNGKDLLMNKPLPEGRYTLCVRALDYRTGAVLSDPNAGCASFYVKYSEAPILTNPKCGDSILPLNPQSVMFSWNPPAGSLSSVEYKLKIVEMLPSNRSAGDALNSATTPPFFETNTQVPFYVYGPIDPPLMEGHTYAFRVTASDPNQKAFFLNNGNSDICYFTVKKSLISTPPVVSTVDYVSTIKPISFHVSGNINYFYSDPNSTSTLPKTGQEPKDLTKANGLANTRISLITAYAMVPHYKIQRLMKTKINGKDVQVNVMVDSFLSYSPDVIPLVDNSPTKIYPNIGQLGQVVGSTITDSFGGFSMNVVSASPCMIIDSFPAQTQKILDAIKKVDEQNGIPYPQYGYVLMKGYAIRIDNRVYWDPKGLIYAINGGSSQATNMKTGIRNFNLDVSVGGAAGGYYNQFELKGQKMDVYILKKQKNPKIPFTEGEGPAETITIDDQIQSSSSPTPKATGGGLFGIYVPQYLPKTDNNKYTVISKKTLNDPNTDHAIFYRLVTYSDPGDEYYVYAKVNGSSFLFTPGQFKEDMISVDPDFYNPSLNFDGTSKWEAITHPYAIAPAFVNLNIKGRMLYNWKDTLGGANARTSSKLMPANTKLKLVNMYVQYDPLNKKAATFSNVKEIAVTYTDAQGNFSFPVGTLDYDKFNTETGQNSFYNHLYLIVDNPYYYSPNGPIYVTAGQDLDLGDQTAYVKEFKYGNRIVTGDYRNYKTLTGMDVFLCRRADDNFDGVPPDEGVAIKSTLTDTSIKDNAGTVYKIIEQTQTQDGGIFRFNRMTLSDLNNPLDKYYIMARSSMGNNDNYLTNQAYPLYVDGGDEIKKKQDWQQIINDFSCSRSSCGIEAQPQAPYITGAVYPLSNTSTSVIRGAKVELFDMGSTPTTHDPNSYSVISYINSVTAEQTQYSDSNGKFRFENLNSYQYKNWKILRISKEGFLDTIMILNASLPFTLGQRADLGKIYLQLPVTLIAFTQTSTMHGVSAKIIVGENYGPLFNTYSWASSTCNPGDPTATATLLCPTGAKVQFIVIPDDHDNYYTDTFYAFVSHSTTKLAPFIIRERQHFFTIVCRDANTGTIIKAHATVTNLPVQIESQDYDLSKYGSSGYASNLIFKNPATSFNIRIVPDGDYVIKEINVIDDASERPASAIQGKIIGVSVAPAVTISGIVYLKSGLKNTPFQDAHVYIEEINDPFVSASTMGGKIAGEYTLRHIPMGQTITLDATATGNYVGDQVIIKTPTSLNSVVKQDLYIKEFTDFDITRLLGFPMQVTKLETTQDGSYVSGRVNIGVGKNAIFGPSTSDYVDINHIKLKKAFNNVRSEQITGKKGETQIEKSTPAILPVITEENTITCQIYGNYSGSITDNNGLKIEEYKNDVGALDGIVNLDDASFGNGFTSDVPVFLDLLSNNSISNATAVSNTVVSKTVGKWKYSFFPGSIISADVLKTFTADGLLADGYDNGFKISDDKLQTITYLLHNTYHHVSTSTASTFDAKGLHLVSMIHTNLDHVDQPDIKFQAMINVDHDNGAQTVTGNNAVSIGIGNWAIVSDQWQIDNKGLVFTNGHLAASGLTVPFTGMTISESQMAFGIFNFSKLRLLNTFDVSISNTNTMCSFGFDDGFGQKGAWSLSLLSTNSTPLATLSGLPDLAASDKIIIANINLYSAGTGSSSSRIILEANHPAVTLNGVSKFYPSSVFGAVDYIAFYGALDLEIPFVTGLGETYYHLKYKNINNTLTHVDDFKFSGLSLRVNGVNVAFDDNSQVFTNNKFQANGILTDVNPSASYKFNVALLKTPSNTQIYIDTINYTKQHFNFGSSGNSYLGRLTGRMNLTGSGNLASWDNFNFEGDITGETGITDAHKHLDFKVKGDIFANKSQIGVTGMDLGGGLGPLDLTVNFSPFYIAGSGHLTPDFDMGSLDLDVEFQMGDGSYYIFGAGMITLKDLPSPLHQFNTVFMAGLTTISSEQMGIIQSHFHDNTFPEGFQQTFSGGLSGLMFMGGFDIPIPLIPQFDLDIGIAHFDLEHGIFANMYAKLNFGEPQFTVGGTVGIWVHVGVGASIVLLCAEVDLKATVSDAILGSISTDKTKDLLHFDTKIELQGSAYAGGGICNSNCETPCIDIPILGHVCSPIPCIKVGFSKTLTLELGATLDVNGIHPDPIWTVK